MPWPNPLTTRPIPSCQRPVQPAPFHSASVDGSSEPWTSNLPARGAFQPDDLSVLQLLADQVAIAIDNARSYQLAEQAVKEMRELDRVKTQFLANMSHELRTPLNSIIGFSRVILKGIDGPISDMQEQDLSAIYAAGQHLLGLINDVLDLAKIEAGKMDITPTETQLAEIITGVMSTAAGLVKDKPIRLVQRVPEDLPAVRADPIRVRQVLLNLLSNAAKFTDEGEVAVEAAVETRSDGLEQVRVSVSDTGPGISAEDQSKLFQAFSQVDDSPTRRTGGSGLGLSISRQLIQLQGGRIGLSSAPGQGSTFFFTLPVFHPLVNPAMERERKLVLAIDDDPQVIKLYERSLDLQGYQVLGLTDPTAATETARQMKPFAITLDIMMPGHDGWQVLTDLKRDSQTRDIPVIVCSILEQQDRGRQLGAADYVLKPILGDGLLNALDRLQKERRVREILIVDSNGDPLSELEKLLASEQGYRPVHARGAVEASDHIREHIPDAVVFDLVAPGAEELALLEELGEDPSLRAIPVYVVSSGGLTSDQQSRLTELGHRTIEKDAGYDVRVLEAIKQTLERASS